MPYPILLIMYIIILNIWVLILDNLRRQKDGAIKVLESKNQHLESVIEFYQLVVKENQNAKTNKSTQTNERTSDTRRE